jgi:DNA polymerase elongation subunit (family B)
MRFYTNISRIGNSICYRGYKDGVREQFRDSFNPVMYLTSRKTDCEWRTLDGRCVEPMVFDSMSEATDFAKRYENVDSLEAHGNTNFAAQYIQKNYPKDIQYDSSVIKIANIDIEVASDDGFPEPERADAEVQSICLKYFGKKTVYIWALEEKYDPFKTQLDINPEDIIFIKCDGELDLILKFIQFWNHKDTCPDVVTGWNVRMFDLPYLINRTNRLIGVDTSKKMSPWNMVREKQVSLQGRTQQVYDIVGIEQLDYWDLFQKFGVYSYGVQESYKLDHISNVVLGEKKLSYEEHGNLYTLYKEDYQKFIDYNIKDVLLVERIDEKMGLIDLAMTIAYKGGCNYQEAFGTTQLWDTYIYRELCSRKIVVPPKMDHGKVDFGGGFVKAPQIGRHSWVVSFDLNSLYPHLIMQYNMSPETIVPTRTSGVTVDNCLDKTRPDSKSPTDCIAANGVHFSKDERGVLPSIIDGLYSERKQIKKNMLGAQSQVEKGVAGAEKEITKLDTQQMAIKIMMNSLYGALGNRWFRYYDIRMAEAITMSGQLSIRWAEKAVNQYMNQIVGTEDFDYVIAIDTDSVYVNFGPLVEKMGLTDTQQIVKVLSQIGEEKFEPLFERSYSDLANYMNAYANKMVMGREAIADAGIWTAKKRYILNVHNNEGVQYAKPKLKIMGIEAVKSSTPASCRDALKGLFKVMITGTEKQTQDAIKLFKNHFKSLAPHEVAFPRGVSDISKWRDASTVYKKGCPIHVRGSLLYNKLLLDNQLEKRYNTIKDGEKIKFLYLDKKNPMKENVIAFYDFLPKEFGLHKYIDYDTQFEKAFLAVVRPVLEAIGWTEEEVISLEDFFG